MRMLVFGFCVLVLVASLSLAAWLQFLEVAQVITKPNPEEEYVEVEWE